MEGPFIVAIVAIIGGIGYAAFEQWTKMKRAEHERGAAADDPRIARLEERVQTLERIVTDRGFQVSDEIERLERTA